MVWPRGENKKLRKRWTIQIQERAFILRKNYTFSWQNVFFRDKGQSLQKGHLTFEMRGDHKGGRRVGQW